MLRALFALAMVGGVAYMLYGVLALHSAGAALVGGAVTIVGVAGFNWLGE